MESEHEAAIAYKDPFLEINMGPPFRRAIADGLRRLLPSRVSVREFVTVLLVMRRWDIVLPLDVRKLLLYEYIGNVNLPVLDFALLSPGQMCVFILDRIGCFEAKLVQRLKGVHVTVRKKLDSLEAARGGGGCCVGRDELITWLWGATTGKA